MYDLEASDESALLGRTSFSHAPAVGFLAGSKVLVTGAAGSIGRRVCAILVGTAAEIVLLDHNDTALAQTERELAANADGTRLLAILGSVTDAPTVERVLSERRPDVVVHAAAYKIVPLVERNPAAAVLSNFVATDLLCARAAAHGVARFVFVSSYEAFRPQNLFGYTKKAAERALAYHARRHPGTDFRAIRFSLVLFSQGSVAVVFAEQARRGEPITITDPAAERYLCSLEEAAISTLSALTTGVTGEVLTLDMGHPVRIVDLAKALIEHFQSSSTVTIVGPRPGEKLKEAPLGGEEGLVESDISGLWRTPMTAWAPERFERYRDALCIAAERGTTSEIVALLREADTP